MQQIRWGITGTGGVARSFATALARVDDAELHAVSSRTEDRAAAFAANHGARRAFGTLEAMLADPDVDVVYVASPHSEHARQALAAVQAGKHVLVEKPFGLSADEASSVFAAARSAGVFVMEALWSRFLPANVRLCELVQDGAIGEVLCVEASFGFQMPPDPAHRLFSPELGGGALLDLGIYPVNLAVQLLGPPDEVLAMSVFGETGVDVSTLVAMHFPRGAVATAHSSLAAPLSCSARVTGSKGWIEVPPMHHCPESLTVCRSSSRLDHPQREVLDLPTGGDGQRHQVHEVHRCLRNGRQGSDVMSWQHTLDLMTVLDRARAHVDLRFPGELRQTAHSATGCPATPG